MKDDTGRGRSRSNTGHVTLGEGNTPLIFSQQIGCEIGLKSLFFKLENCNPSGSYKDRFSASQIDLLLRSGVRSCLATSSGNTGASIAAFCARYGLKCGIIVGESVPTGKLEQMQAHGASLLRVADYDTSPEVGQRVLEFLLNFSKSHGLPFVISSYRHCPVGMSGVESLSAELFDQLDGEIDHVFVPVGGGGLFTAVCRGFFKKGPSIPRVHAVQTKGCSTIAAAWLRGDDEIRSVTSTTTVTGISVSYNVDGDEALRMLRRVNGLGLAVSDEDVYAAQQMLLDREGIFAEPAGAASLAGLIAGVKAGQIDRHCRIVCLVTGSGFKDPSSISRAAANCPAIWIGFDELEGNLIQLVSPTAEHEDPEQSNGAS